jgi:hypothetical protein
MGIRSIFISLDFPETDTSNQHWLWQMTHHLNRFHAKPARHARRTGSILNTSFDICAQANYVTRAG